MDAPLYRRAAARIPEAAARITATLAAEVPFYRVLPRELLDGEITETAATNMRLFYRVVRGDREPEQWELAELASSAARRAQERIPLDAILAACHTGARVALEMLGELAGPEDTDALIAAGPRAVRYLQSMIPVVTDAYIQEQQALHGEERAVRRALVAALLAGDDQLRLAELAERAGLDLAPCYAILVLHPRPTVDRASAVATRRMLRLVQAELDAHTPAGGHVLAALDATGGPVLVSADETTLDTELKRLADLVARIGGDVHAGAASAPDLQAVPAAVREAREAADLAARLGRPFGLYRLDDVLIEHQLSRPGPARDRLTAMLRPLAGHPHLTEALRSYVAHGYNRHQAASAIHVHRNTLNYRLRRVAALTGLNPAHPDSVRLLAAALTVHDLTEGPAR
ncbi:PucR family transcriptional regulator [Streptomyces halobius]|uniref:Helix-turn-helix domain-containing protein n=1 Tax=Streptomyces halobius TaxID=2879846 RepID=A0ABY4M2P4_9ACTN|nr:helix-turn-helix domain-containing protein [Streptomyces halobius]UQA92031.1 helix-turn-helix domain-containing protein [Streptomyces halobius]